MPGQTLSQSRLMKCLAALGRHPELPGDLLAAGNAVRFPELGVLEAAGRHRRWWIAEIATYWFERRHAPTWPLVPCFGQYRLEDVLRRAVIEGWEWGDFIAAVADIERHPPTPKTRIMVKGTLYSRDPKTREYNSTPLFTDAGYDGSMCVRECLDSGQSVALSTSFVEVTHRIHPGASLDEYLASARRAWQQGQIKRHLPDFDPTLNNKPGSGIEYAEHVDLYSKWFDHHCVRQQPTSRFVDAVANGTISIEGWAQAPSRSAIEQRLRDARSWLRSGMQGEHESLDALLRCAKVIAEDTLEVRTPDGRHMFLASYIEMLDDPAKWQTGLAEVS